MTAPNYLTGYLNPAYAVSLSEFGAPRLFPLSQSSILVRQIPNTLDYDAMGCYPLFACPNWSALEQDLNAVDKDLVSLVVVTDPFGDYDPILLKACFPHLVYAFKTHFVVDLTHAPESYIGSHHRRYVKKSLEHIQIERCNNPLDYLDIWFDLYQALIERHSITGVAKFSHTCFERQLQVPGLVMFRAVYELQTVGMLLWYVQNNIGYYHLGAYSKVGYTMRSSFALFWTALNYFAQQGLRWLDLGAGAGLSTKDDGLTRFKSGWANDTRTAYLCGRIFDIEKYNELVQVGAIPATNYFPRYRHGEHR